MIFLLKLSILNYMTFVLQRTSIHNYMTFQGAAVKFRRQFDHITIQEWTNILCTVSALSFTHTQDKLAWK